MHLIAMLKRLLRIFDFDPKNIPAVFWAITILSGAGLLVSVFRWQLVDWVTVFIEPFIEIIVFGLFAIVLIWSAIHALLPFKGSRANRFIPFVLGLAILTIFIFVPFSEINSKIDFAFHLQARTTVAEQIVRSHASSPVKPDWNAEVIPLPGLSEDGEGMYLHTQKKQMVFFFTFRGILDHFSGFVYSVNDIAPEVNDFGGNIIEVDHLRKNWYWAAST